MSQMLLTNASDGTRELVGKVALITDSMSGIGLGIARTLARNGATIVLNGSGKPEEIARVRNEMEREFAVKVAYSDADMSSPDAIAMMVAAIMGEQGRLDILVNNAGIQRVAPIAEFPPAKWEQILAINLSSAFHTIRLATPLMRGNGYGRIINIASAHGLVASPFKSAYASAKHGILGLTKTVALETAETPITCNAICPGYVWTLLVEAQIKGQAKMREVLAQRPNRRFATVEEIGALTAFLASSHAASITGAAIPVDGGWVAH